jgi:hypothetical protein
MFPRLTLSQKQLDTSCESVSESDSASLLIPPIEMACAYTIKINLSSFISIDFSLPHLHQSPKRSFPPCGVA